MDLGGATANETGAGEGGVATADVTDAGEGSVTMANETGEAAV
jgi:hypothetical protein